MDTAGLYHRVMSSVISRSKKEFAAEHLSETVLNRLAKLWEEKLLGGVAIDVNTSSTATPSLGADEKSPHNRSKMIHSNEERKKRERESLLADECLAENKRIKHHMEDADERKVEFDRLTESNLSSDSDGELDESNLESAHVLLGQFEKVSRSKSKWKCFLKDGIVTINGRDIAFSRATGEFRWA